MIFGDTDFPPENLDDNLEGERIQAIDPSNDKFPVCHTLMMET